MFIAIKYGCKEEQLFNPDCSLIQLVNDIRNRCHCPRGAGVALIETDHKGLLVSGDVIELKEDSLDNGAELFTMRSEYVLLAIYKRESGNSKYVSLLEDISPELAMKLDSLSNPKAAGENKPPKGWPKVHHHTRKQSKAVLTQQASTTTKGKRTASRGGRGKT